MLEKKSNFIIILFILGVFVFLFSIYFRNSLILETIEIYANLNISKTTGFDLNDTALTFGNLVPGSSSSRSFVIENNYGFPIKIRINSKGDISRFLSFEKIHRIEQNKSKKIIIGVIVSEGEIYKSYSGELVIIMEKSLNF